MILLYKPSWFVCRSCGVPADLTSKTNHILLKVCTVKISFVVPESESISYSISWNRFTFLGTFQLTFYPGTKKYRNSICFLVHSQITESISLLLPRVLGFHAWKKKSIRFSWCAPRELVRNLLVFACRLVKSTGATKTRWQVPITWINSLGALRLYAWKLKESISLLVLRLTRELDR